jgi:hypothetical protein
MTAIATMNKGKKRNRDAPFLSGSSGEPVAADFSDAMVTSAVKMSCAVIAIRCPGRFWRSESSQANLSGIDVRLQHFGINLPHRPGIFLHFFLERLKIILKLTECCRARIIEG